MTEAVVVSTARTPIGKAFRGAFNQTHGAVLAGHAIQHAVARGAPAQALVQPQRFGDLLFHRVQGVQRGHGLLEDHGDAAAADGAQQWGGGAHQLQGGTLRSVEPYRPARVLCHAAQELQNRQRRVTTVGSFQIPEQHIVLNPVDDRDRNGNKSQNKR